MILNQSKHYTDKSAKYTDRINKFAKKIEDIDKMKRGEIYKANAKRSLNFVVAGLIAKKAQFDKLAARHFVSPMIKNEDVAQTEEAAVL